MHSNLSTNYSNLSKEDLIKRLREEVLIKDNLLQSIKASGILTWEYNFEKEELSLGEGSLEIVGYPHDSEMPLNELLDRIHPDDTERLQLNLLKYIEKYPENHEYRIRVRDINNQYRWISSKGRLLKTDQGKNDKIFGILQVVDNEDKDLTPEMISESRFKTFAEHAKEGIIIYNKDKVITDLNHATEVIFGYHYDEVKSRKLDELLDSKTRDRLSTIKNTNEYLEFLAVKKNGEKIYLEVFNKESEQGVGIILINNIHKRKTAELELKRHERHLQELIDQRTNELYIKQKEYQALISNLQGMAYQYIPLKNNKWEITFVSDGSKDLTGYAAEDFLNGKLDVGSDLVDTNYNEEVWKEITKKLTKKQNFNVSYPITTKEGQTKWILDSGIGVYDDKGKLHSLEGIMLDITKEKEQEERLILAKEEISQQNKLIKQREKSYSTLLKNLQGMAYRVEGNMDIIIYISDGCQDLTGYSPGEILSHNKFFETQIVRQDYQKIIEKTINKAIDNKETYEVEYPIKCKNGQEKWVTERGVGIYSTDGSLEYLEGFIIDITKSKELEAELKEANHELSASEEELRQQSEELSTLNENLEIQKKELEHTVFQLKNTKDQLIQTEKMASLGVLVAGIAHELNNPIGYIKSSSEALKMLLEDLQEELDQVDKSELFQEISKDVEQMISHINSGARQAAEIVKGLRTFSRMDKEKIERHNLIDTIDNVLLMLHNSYKYSITIHRDLEEIPPIQCAPGQINQVFLNLINNAIQAIEGDGNIWITAKSKDNRVIITIKDDGAGISEENQKRIFEPFFTTKEPGQGTGLGLSISLGILQDHNGSIYLESDNSGTAFTVSLPVSQGNNINMN